MDRTYRWRERFSTLSAEIALGSEANEAQHAQSRREGRRSPGRAEMPTIGMGCIQRLGLIAAVVVACLGASTAHAETVLRIGNVGEPGSLDPQQISSTYENRVVGDMFLGLTTEAADGSMVPGAAESWTIDDDGRVYTFKLRNHRWSDGQAVTADDFVFAFRRVLEPAFAGIYASLLYPSPPQAAGYSEQCQLTVLVQLLVAGALLLDIGADGPLVALPADGAGEIAVAPELPAP